MNAQLSASELQRLLALPAGRELDAAVAEHVLGWRWYRWERGAQWAESWPGAAGRWIDDPVHPAAKTHDVEGGRRVETAPAGPLHDDWDDERVLPLFSADVAAAWRVVEALDARGFAIDLRTWQPGVGGGASCTFYHATLGMHDADGETVPLAIVRAAFQAAASAR